MTPREQFRRETARQILLAAFTDPQCEPEENEAWMDWAEILCDDAVKMADMLTAKLDETEPEGEHIRG